MGFLVASRMRNQSDDGEANDETLDKYSVAVPGLVPPHLPDLLSGSGQRATVREGGVLDIDAPNIPKGTLRISEESYPEPGTEVVVKGARNPYCKTVEQVEREKAERERRRELKQKARERYRAWKKRRDREEAEEFWSQYDIPFDHHIAKKGRRSQLQRGSTGTGEDARTVTHLYVQEAFEEGRLQRDENSYLCDDSAEIRFTPDSPWRSDGKDEDAEGLLPPVTCKTCLKRMERWRVND